MPTTYRILGQAAPAAAADGDVYTVPAGTQAIVSTVVVCNTGAAGTFRLHARPDGAVAGVGNAIAYDVAIGASEAITLTLGITLDAADVLTGRSSTGAVTFSAFGSEIS